MVQHYVRPPGGAAGVGIQMLDVLKKFGEIDLLSTLQYDPEAADEYYGTDLASAGINYIPVQDPLLKFMKRVRLPNGLVTLHALMKSAKRRVASHQYDLVCSACDELDLGAPAIQYIHYPWNLYPRPDAPPGWNQRWYLQAVIAVYNRLCRLYSGFRYRGVYQNLTLANSRWTGEKMRQKYPELQYLVMHPPALAELIEDDRTRRRERFLSIGRCAPEKRWLQLIDIVEGIRARGHDVGLTLAGSRDKGFYEQAVAERIEAAGDWVVRVADFSREELQELLVTHQYGLHGMLDEHYGMAVAELILGGCLTSVHNDGGQVEIVTNPQLRYNSIEDAIDKWDTVLSSPELREQLLAEQMEGREHLKKERFLEEFEELVEVALERGVEGVVHGLRAGHLEHLGPLH